MDLFKSLKEIETLYENLIENAKKERLDQIELLENEQKKNLEEIIKKKMEFVNSVLNDLSEEVKNYIINFEKKNNEIIKKIELNYKKNKSELTQSIIEKLGYDF